jgi:soluble lytic murein transglycosylase
MRLREGAVAGASFADCLALTAARPGWPGMERLRRNCEQVMGPDVVPGNLLAWFSGATPLTGEGAAAWARQLTAMGQGQQAVQVVQDAWLGQGLTDAGQAAMLAGFADVLAPLHWPRTDAMLWRTRTQDAERMLPLLTADQQLLARARIAMIRGDGDRMALFAALPEALRADPGLTYDRYNRLAEQGDFTAALELLMPRNDDPALLGDPFRWAAWRGQIGRWLMREGRPRDAYRVASQHHQTGGEFLADLEWLSGYLALRYLDDPATALRHFTTMEGAVSGPISRSRAAYWRARAEEALGDPAFTASYARAAQNQTAFYGLLAAERLGLPLDPALAGGEVFPDWRQGAYLTTDLNAAMLLLIAAGRQNEAILFALKQAQTLDRTGIGQLGAMLLEMGEPFYALTVAKEAADRDIVIPAIYFPVHPVAQMEIPVEPALALSVARRESEFRVDAGSPVGALGLMQLMPGTAEEVASDLGLEYSRGRLTSDWTYNATLGTQYLLGLELEFGLSPVLVAAGYNAGPGRPREWITARGDPRTGAVDIVDWIEHIPFAETRTYVQRVTESIPVYRARLTGQTGAVAFTALLQGAPAVPRPPLRPDRSAPAVVPDPVAAVVESVVTAPASGGAVAVTIRPVVRPGVRASRSTPRGRWPGPDKWPPHGPRPVAASGRARGQCRWTRQRPDRRQTACGRG